MFLLAGNILFKRIDQFFRGIIGDSGNSYRVFGNSCCFLEILGIHTASSGFSVVGISEFWDGKGFLGRGLLRPDGEKCEPSSLYFPVPSIQKTYYSPPENISQVSRKHFQPSRKHLPNFQKTSSKVFRKYLSPSKKYLSSLPRKHLSKVSSNPILSLQKANYKHPEIHLVPIAKNHDSKI